MNSYSVEIKTNSPDMGLYHDEITIKLPPVLVTKLSTHFKSQLVSAPCSIKEKNYETFRALFSEAYHQWRTLAMENKK